MTSGSLKDLVPGDDDQIEKDLEWIDALQRELQDALLALQACLNADAKHLSPSTRAIAFSRLHDAADTICQYVNRNPLPKSVASNVVAWLAPPICDLACCCVQLREEAIAGEINGETLDRFCAVTGIVRGEIKNVHELVVFEKVSRRREQDGPVASQANQSHKAAFVDETNQKHWQPKNLAKAKRISREITKKRKDVNSIKEAAVQVAKENGDLRMTPSAIEQMYYRYKRYERARNADQKTREKLTRPLTSEKNSKKVESYSK